MCQQLKFLTIPNNISGSQVADCFVLNILTNLVSEPNPHMSHIRIIYWNIRTKLCILKFIYFVSKI